MTSADLPQAASHVRLPLRAGLPLLHEEGACLPLRSRHGQCVACARSCPTGALAVGVDAVRLSEACTGCGRCTAACPTQALALPELLALPMPLAAPPEVAPPRPLRVECRKVGPEMRAEGTLVLPCTGALTAGQLLAHAAAGIPVQVVDRGWCEGCECGCSDARPAHPAAAALENAALWLRALDLPPQASLVHEPLPISLRPAATPPAPEAAGSAIDRRRFFRAALERPAGRGKPLPMGADGRAAYPADRRLPSPERARQLAALEQLAVQQRTEVPAEFFPRLHADAACCDRRMCVALCPTAALAVADDGAAAHLRLDPRRCIACGTCVRACPEGALALTAQGGTPELQVLAVHRRQRCPACGDAFTTAVAGTEADHDPDAAAALCPTCTKSRRFMDDARRQLFGALT